MQGNIYNSFFRIKVLSWEGFVCSTTEIDRDLSALVAGLNIHHNTLYYRIKRIEDILQFSLQDFNNWFNVQLACKIYQFLYPEYEIIHFSDESC